MNPYLLLVLNVLLVTGAQLLLKRGAGEAALSTWTVGGVACYIASFLVWLRALKQLPLGVAFPLTSATHLLVPLASWLLLGESIPPLRWSGILLVAAGLVFCVPEDR